MHVPIWQERLWQVALSTRQKNHPITWRLQLLVKNMHYLWYPCWSDLTFMQRLQHVERK